MLDFLRQLFSAGDYMPHAHCYLWPSDPALLWVHLLSDLLIGLAYVAISLTLVILVHRGRRDIAFHGMFLAFGTFIVACGCTHFMEVWTLFHAHYWLSGIVKIVTAVASVLTAFALPPLVPVALGMLRASRLSEERRAEAESANAELNRLYGKLKEFDELKTQFFANISHELRTPLALILGPADRLLAGTELSQGQRQDLELIARNARTLLKHVNDLLDVSKLEAGKMKIDYSEVDLARTVRLAAAHFDGLARERGIEFEVQTPERLQAQFDMDKIQRALLNGLSNAFKFTPPGGRVRMSLAESPPGPGEAPQAEIAIADSGPGVPETLREVVFERFRQAEGGADRRFGGTGLGLAIVRDFLTLHGGTASLGQAPEGGAELRLRLPLTAPEGAEVRPEPSREADTSDIARAVVQELRGGDVRSTAAGEPSAPLVLVAEDNPDMNQFIAETLGPDYRVETARDGEEALEKATALKPDLILSDVMMPRMSGDRLVEAVREHPELEGVPLVMLTAKADDELRIRLLREGAQDYVMKPFSAEELRARVRNQVSMKRTRDVLQRELETHLYDLELLAAEVSYRKRELYDSLLATQAALERAESASRVKSNFLRMVSHELRTPLTTLQLQLQLLQRDREATLSPRQAEGLRKMGLSSARLLELIESLLEYARLQSGRATLQIDTIDLSSLARGVVEEMSPQAELKSLELRVYPDRAGGSPVLLRSDPRLVRLILVNLVGNAIKFTESGFVEVSVYRDAEGVRLAVRDTGPGIPPERQSTIFEAFEHLEPVQRKHTPGVGLGLSIAREMVEALGGRIELHSEVGKGSTFTVVLPPSED